MHVYNVFLIVYRTQKKEGGFLDISHKYIPIIYISVGLFVFWPSDI